MSELPISCFRCRRRKIKCNKRKPCNQCIKQDVPCQFPSKFRNISVEEAPKQENEHSGSTTSGSMDHVGSASPDVSKLEEQVRRLEMENQYIREEFHRKLGEAIEKNEEEISARTETAAFEISGETTENGEKYYGPMSSNNMTEDLDNITGKNSTLDSTAALKHHSWTSSPFKINESDHDSDGSSSSDLLSEFSKKEPMPWIVGRNESPERNLEAIKHLVRECFETKTYDYFISEDKVLQFIEDYASIPDLTWEGTDDLLLLHMILILSLQRISPTSYNQLFRPAVRNFQQLWDAIKPLKRRLFRQFSRLRHNLVNESYVTVQAYILCTEWEFIEQRYEESWSMMFHCCSIAYALGLHVVAKSSSSSFESMISGADMSSGSQESGDLGQKSKDGYDDFYVDELPKLRVWFALRNLNSQMCSILGRPNPIMIQVNTVSLPMTSISNVEDAETLNNLTNSQLKSGLSECIRMSNSSIIESFLQKISMDNVWTINQQFSEEIDKLSYYLSPRYESSIDGVVKKIDSLTDMPTTVTRKDVLVDLIVLHVNRVKLLQPFIDKSPPNKNALNFIMGSILLFYEHTCELVSEFVKKEIPRILDSDEANEGEIRLDKVFVYRDPFFASFIYQGIVVTFILMNMRSKDFIQDNNGHFISQVEGQLQMLLGLHSSISKLVKENIHLWSQSNVYLMKKILIHIGIMKQAFKDKSSGMSSAFGGFEFDPQIAEMLGNNLKDPFWVVNPENSPNFLGFTDRDLPGARNNNGTSIMMNQSQGSKLRLSNYPSYESSTSIKADGAQLQDEIKTMPDFTQDALMSSGQSQYEQIDQMGDQIGDQMGEQMDFADSMNIDRDDTTTAFGSNALAPS